jgi:hypothetical protein
MGLTSIVCCALLLGLTALAAAQPSLKDIDLFGTTQITLDQIQKQYGDQIRQFARARLSNDTLRAERLKQEIESNIHQMGDFAYVKLSLIRDYDPGRPAYLTIDVVDAKDRESRMRFLPAPKGSFPDPEGLLALWDEYMKTGWELAEKDELDFEKMECPAFHCLFGFDHPKLKKFAPIFTSRVPENKARLIQILREDGNADHRAGAAFLLAHIQDGQELIRIISPSIFDPAELVRNNAMRVLAYISDAHKEIEIPLAPVLKAMNFPATTDRNKASAILCGLADRAEYQKTIAQGCGATLLQMLKLSQPNNHDHAYIVLRKISGKEFGDRDYETWEKWLREYQ